jgi:type II secretory pathway pseudopilin PulG
MSLKKSPVLSVSKGFSLIEVLIFVTILSLFLITAASIITVSIRQNSLKVNMLKAEHYNEQLLEWIRSEKEADWNTFTTNADGTGITYCFTDSSYSWNSSPCGYDLLGMFKRTALLKSFGNPATKVEVTAYTDWQEGGNTHSTKLHTIYTIWEE